MSYCIAFEKVQTFCFYKKNPPQGLLSHASKQYFKYFFGVIRIRPWLNNALTNESGQRATIKQFATNVLARYYFILVIDNIQSKFSNQVNIKLYGLAPLPFIQMKKV